MYAIVDIETTGGLAGRHRITEVAVLLHDGTQVTGTFSTLVNPQQEIPPFISQLTGITNDMVATAPSFSDVAEELYSLLKGRIFVAHNAAFDYSFIKQLLDEEGYPFQERKLCTVRASRKLLPGFRSYSLGNLCRDLNITVENRHRAMGDAAATTLLFEMLLAADNQGVLDDLLKRHTGQQALPPHLDKAIVNQLPKRPGVYYFHDEKGRLLYVGKALNIRSRVKNHFHFADHDGQENQLRDAIYDVTYTETGNEFIALLLETDEIKRKMPPHNKALKYWSRNYCIFSFTGQNGYRHLAMERFRNNLQPLRVFPSFLKARAFMKEKVAEFQLCPRYTHLQTGKGACTHRASNMCLGACTAEESASDYNVRVDAAVESFEAEAGTYMILGKGREAGERTAVLVENGHYLGFGFIPPDVTIYGMEELKDFIQWRPDFPDIQYLLMRHLEKHPESRVMLSQNRTENQQ